MASVSAWRERRDLGGEQLAEHPIGGRVSHLEVHVAGLSFHGQLQKGVEHLLAEGTLGRFHAGSLARESGGGISRVVAWANARVRRGGRAAAGGAGLPARRARSPRRSSWPSGWRSRCSSRGRPASARPSWPSRSPRPRGGSCSGSSATRGSTRPRRSTSGSTASSSSTPRCSRNASARRWPGRRTLAEAADRLDAEGNVFFSERFLLPRPVLQAVLVRRAGAAPRRRGRQGRPGVRGLPPRGAGRPRGDRARAGDHARPPPAAPGPHLQRHARALRRAPAPLPPPLHRLPLPGARARHRPLPRARASPRSWRGRRWPRWRCCAPMDLKKAPSISETLDWIRSLVLLQAHALDGRVVSETLNVLLKHEADLAAARPRVDEIARGVDPWRPVDAPWPAPASWLRGCSRDSGTGSLPVKVGSRAVPSDRLNLSSDGGRRPGARPGELGAAPREATGLAFARVRQVHGCRVVEAGAGTEPVEEADGADHVGARGRRLRLGRRLRAGAPRRPPERSGGGGPRRVEGDHRPGGCRGGVRALVDRHGARPADLLAAIGPGIGPCCFEVSRDLAVRFRDEVGPVTGNPTGSRLASRPLAGQRGPAAEGGASTRPDRDARALHLM